MLRRLSSLMLILAAAAPAFGQALEIGEEGSPLTIESLNVRADVDEGIALVDVDQTFRNDSAQQLEGTYRFKLPEKAVVHSFSMWIDGKEKHGEVLEAKRARRIYESVIASKQDPALLEEIGWRTFKVSVFPIPAKDTVRIRLVYAHVVDDDLGLRTLEIPMPEGVPVGVANVSINVRDQQGVDVLDCPTHAAAQVLHDDVMGAITWSEQDFAPSGPIKVRSAPRVDGVGMAFLAHRLEEAGEGTFLVRVVPRLDDLPQLPRDVVFVVDRSGSMKGRKLAQAQAALLHGLSTLKEGDRFSIVAFSSNTQVLTNDGLVPANAAWLAKGKTFAERLNASGGTNIDKALTLATSMRTKAADRLFVVSFLTDGQPTVGEKRPKNIVSNYRQRSGGAVRLFAFGVGDGVKDFLLSQLADVSRGAAEYVREDEDLEVKLSAFFDKVESPILTDVSVSVEGDAVQVLSAEPEVMPDVFRGTAVVSAGRYTGSGPVTLRLKGRIGATPVEVVHEVAFPAVAGGRAHVAQLWARMRIDRLLDELRVHGMVPEIRDEIVRLGLRYQVVTPYTSFLIVEDDVHIPDENELARVPEDQKPSADAGDGDSVAPVGTSPDDGTTSGDGTVAQGDPGSDVPPNSREPSDPQAPSEGGAPTSPGGDTGGSSESAAGPTASDAPEPTGGSGSSGSGGGAYRGPTGSPPQNGRESSGGGGGGDSSRTPNDVGSGASESSEGASAGGGDVGGPSTGGGAGGAGRPSGTSSSRADASWALWWETNGPVLRGDDRRVAPRLSADVRDDVVVPALRRAMFDRRAHWFLGVESQRALARLGDDAEHVRGLARRMLLGRPLDGEPAFHPGRMESAARLLVDGGGLSDQDRADLIAVLGDSSRKRSFVRPFAALALGLAGAPPEIDQRTQRALSEAIADPDGVEGLRPAAIFALGLLGDRRSVEPLLAALETGEWDGVRLGDLELAYVVDALGRLGDPADNGGPGGSAVVARLERMLLDAGRKRTSAVVKRAIPAALARLAREARPADRKRIVSALLQAQRTKHDPSTADFAGIALGRIAAAEDVAADTRRSARSGLLGRVSKRRGATSPILAVALGLAGPDDKTIAAVKRAQSPRADANTQVGATIALGLLGQSDSATWLRDLACDPGVSPDARIASCEALVMIDARTELPYLVETARSESSPTMRFALESACIALGDQSHLESVLDTLRAADADDAVRDRAATILGRFGGDDEARALARIVADDTGATWRTRSLAARALGGMAMASDTRFRIAADFPYRARTPAIWQFMDWK